MRISVLRDDPEQLELKLTPKASWFMLVFGTLFVVAGIATAWFLGCVSLVTIDQSELRFDQRLFHQIQVNEVAIPVEQIREVNTKVYHFGISQSYEVNVVTDHKEIPIPFPDLDGDQKKVMADQIHAAIHEGQNTSYQSSEATMWLGIFLGVACICAGLVAFYFLQTCWIVADRKINQIRVKCRHWLVPVAPRVESTRLSEIIQIGEEEFVVGDGMPTPTASSKFVFLVMKNGPNVQLANGPMFTDKSAEQIQRLLTKWLRNNKR